jgi:hypothetical protein
MDLIGQKARTYFLAVDVQAGDRRLPRRKTRGGRIRFTSLLRRRVMMVVDGLPGRMMAVLYAHPHRPIRR